MEASNAAKMRAALVKIEKMAHCNLCNVYPKYRDMFNNKIGGIEREARAALSAPPHEAKWTTNGGYEFACCSKCGHLQYAGWDSCAEQAEKIGDFHELYKFCPNCGAQMKGETDGSK